MNFLEKMDLLSDTLTINVKGQSTYNTKFGGFITIIAIITCSILSGYFLIQTFGRKQVAVITSQELNTKPFYDFTKFPIILDILNEWGLPFKEPERIFEIAPKVWERNESMIWSWEDLEIEKCNFSWYPEYEDKLKKELGDSFLFCFNPNNPHNKNKLYNKGSYKNTDPIHHLAIHFLKCANDTTKNKTNCLPPDEIEEKITFMYLRYVLIDTTIDSTQEVPGTSFLTISDLLLNSKLFKIFNFSFREIIYTSDLGYVFESKEELTYYSLEPINIEISLGTRGDEFSAIRLINSESRIRYFRKYSKLQDVVAQVGGVLKLILYVAKIAVSYISSKSFLNEITLKMYEIKRITNPEISGSNILHLNLSHLPIDVQKGRRTIVKSLRLNLFEYMLPLKLLNKRNTPSILDKVDSHIKKTFSFEKIFSTIIDLRKLKTILLSKEEITSLKNFNKPTIKQYPNHIDIDDYDNEENNNKININEDVVMRNLNSEIGNRVIKLIHIK